jgi:hypothetical protein
MEAGGANHRISHHPKSGALVRRENRQSTE